MEVDKEYIILQAEYRKINENKDDIFPLEWYNKKNYELKKQILKNCIQNNILIKDSEYYYNFRINSLN